MLRLTKKKEKIKAKMTNNYENIVFVVIFFISSLFAASVFDFSQSSFSWHDQQRLYQLIALFLSCFFALYIPPVSLPHTANNLILIIFFIGLLSCLNSIYPVWAMKEWARYLSLTLLALLLGNLLHDHKKQTLLIFLLAIICSLLADIVRASY